MSENQPDDDFSEADGNEAEAFTPDFSETEPLEGEVLKPGEKSEQEKANEKAAREAYAAETDPLKDAFYKMMCSVSNQAAKLVGKNVPEGEAIEAMKLKNRGVVGRAASDQVFDKLWKRGEWLQNQLRKLKHVNKLEQEWGAIWMLMVEMTEATLDEIEARNRAYQQKQQAAKGQQQPQQEAA